MQAKVIREYKKKTKGDPVQCFYSCCLSPEKALALCVAPVALLHMWNGCVVVDCGFNYFKNTMIFNIDCHYRIEPVPLYSQHQADDCLVSKEPKPKFLWHDQTKLLHLYCFSHCDGKLEEESLVVEDEEAFEVEQQNITLGYFQNYCYFCDP